MSIFTFNFYLFNDWFRTWEVRREKEKKVNDRISWKWTFGGIRVSKREIVRNKCVKQFIYCIDYMMMNTVYIFITTVTPKA